MRLSQLDIAKHKKNRRNKTDLFLLTNIREEESTVSFFLKEVYSRVELAHYFWARTKGEYDLEK